MVLRSLLFGSSLLAAALGSVPQSSDEFAPLEALHPNRALMPDKEEVIRFTQGSNRVLPFIKRVGTVTHLTGVAYLPVLLHSGRHAEFYGEQYSGKGTILGPHYKCGLDVEPLRHDKKPLTKPNASARF